MTDVLLTHSYFLKFDPKQWRNQTPYPPLATLYSAATLRKQGFSVKFIDTMFWDSPEQLAGELTLDTPKVVFICDDGFNYLTKMCLTNMREAAVAMIARARSAGATVIMSSSDATDHPDIYLRAGANFIIAGEVEQTLIEWMRIFSAGGVDFSEIPGLIFLKEDVVTRTAKRENLRQLDDLPDPAWDLIDVTAYRNAWLARAGYFSLNVATTRGCPYKCNWCAKPIYGNRYFNRSPERVVTEIEMLVRSFHVQHIWFCDDIFGLKPGWVQRFAELIAARKVPIRFKIQSRVDLLLKEDQIDALARAGCDEVWVGAESGSQKILDAMDKGTKVSQIHEAVQRMKVAGLKPCLFLQFGYPGEEREDIEATLSMVRSVMPHDIGISVSYPLPGTVFYDRVKAELTEKRNWTDSDELAIMFHSTFKPAFYKVLQRYVHADFRKRKALSSVAASLRGRGQGAAVAVRKFMSLFYRYPQTLVMKLILQRYAQRI